MAERAWEETALRARTSLHARVPPFPAHPQAGLTVRRGRPGTADGIMVRPHRERLSSVSCVSGASEALRPMGTILDAVEGAFPGQIK